ncbi:MAG: polyprenyl synthetase family protein [Bacteroidia bacterium]|nr:polyprenyl synthetase family protein [Bacteroidia bacterium]
MDKESILHKIQEPLGNTLEEFEIKFRQSLQSKTPLLDKILHFIVRRKGKQIRPMFVFLTSRVFGPIGESSHTAAALIELLHTATLIHDDVVDNSYERRGFFSLNALWKNKISVLVGDFLLARGLMLSMEKKEFELLSIVTQAVKEMSEGELLQIEKARKMDIDESVYFDIIGKKTAALLAACGACGASAQRQPENVVALCKDIGHHCGIAFQIKDDLFDLGYGTRIGKPTFVDIQEQKLTLPLIHCLQHLPFLEKQKLLFTIRTTKNTDKKTRDYYLSCLEKTQSLAYAHGKMNEHAQKALELSEKLPENNARSALQTLIRYTVERTK